MTLAQFAATARRTVFEELTDGKAPSEGSFDEARLRDGQAKGRPLIGTTRFEPEAILFEFIYPDPNGAPIVLTVRLDAPERIVYLPVPDWVVAQVWEGEVLGSWAFESEAAEQLARLARLLEPERNRELFAANSVIGKR